MLAYRWLWLACGSVRHEQRSPAAVAGVEGAAVVVAVDYEADAAQYEALGHGAEQSAVYGVGLAQGLHPVVVFGGAGGCPARHYEGALGRGHGVAGQRGAAAHVHPLAAGRRAVEGHDVAHADAVGEDAAVAEQAVHAACAQPVAPPVHQHAVARLEHWLKAVAAHGVDGEEESTEQSHGQCRGCQCQYGFQPCPHLPVGVLVPRGASLDVVDKLEQPVPAHACQAIAVGVARPPDEDGLAHYVVFGHEAPVARVGRVVAVVAHHPVVVHLEGVRAGLAAVDVYLAVAHLQVVALVCAYGALVDGQVVEREVDALALGRYPHRAVVVARPVLVAVEGVDVHVGGVGVQLYALHQVAALREHGHGPLCERHVAHGIQAHDVFVGNAELAHYVFGQRLAQLDVVCVLHVVGLLVWLAVKVHYAVLYLQRLAGQSHAPLDVVLAAVGRARYHLAILAGVVGYVLPACAVHGVVVSHALLCRERVGGGALARYLVAQRVAQRVEVHGLVLRRGAQRVARGVVEHHYVVELNVAEAFYAAVVPVGPLYVRLALNHGQRVLRERHGERRLGYSRAVAHLAHEEVVAGEERLLERRRRYDVVLEEEQVDEIHCHEGEDDGVDPRHHEPHGRLGVFPPLPAYLLGDVHVVDEGHHYEPPPALHPYQEQQVEGHDHAALDPLAAHVSLFFDSHFGCALLLVV